MTLHEAIRALLEEYHLDEWIEVIRDDAKADEAWTGLSTEHPRVQSFKTVCRVLRAEVTR